MRTRRVSVDAVVAVGQASSSGAMQQKDSSRATIGSGSAATTGPFADVVSRGALAGTRRRATARSTTSASVSTGSLIFRRASRLPSRALSATATNSRRRGVGYADSTRNGCDGTARLTHHRTGVRRKTARKSSPKSLRPIRVRSGRRSTVSPSAELAKDGSGPRSRLRSRSRQCRRRGTSDRRRSAR